MENWNNETPKPVSPPEGELVPDAPPKPVEAPPARRRRGFAAMDPNLVREISRKGGKAAHVAGTAHEFTSDEARAAGRKGGLATHAKLKQQAAAPEAPAADSTQSK